MAVARLSIQVTPEEKVKLEKIAEKHGVSLSVLCRDALDLYSGLDPKFWERVKGRSKTLNVSVPVVMQNMIAKQMAYDAAEITVYGNKDRLLDEFIFTSEGIITGERLFERMKADFIGDLERSRAAYLRRRINDGKPISDHETKWLENYDQEQAQWQESRERDEMDVEQDRKGVLSPDEISQTRADIHKKGE